MKGFLLFLVGGIVGAVATFFVAVGVGAGAGIVTGVKAGACLTVEAAKEQGLISQDQVNQVLTAAAKQIADSGTEVPDITGGDAACQTFIAELKQANAN
jgi:hypothetical protein